MKFAVFSVSTPDYPPDVAVAKIRECGYDGIEWRVIDQKPSASGSPFWSRNLATLPFSSFEQDAPAWRKLTEEAGLEMPSLGTYVSCDEPEAIESAMRGARLMGVSQLRVRVPEYDGKEAFLPIWDRARAQYKDVAALAAKHGVKALLELHHKSVVTSASAARLFLGELDPTHVGVIHDAGNMVFEGFETYRLGFEILGPYLAHIHIKNARWFPERYVDNNQTVLWRCDWAPVRKGIINNRELFAALRAVGYDGWVGLEDFSTERKLDDRLKENLEYLKEIQEDLDAASAT